ncbi:hypothetical protein OBA39_04280 [Acidimicrobiaceae bacterium]|nr:hypothetical protein [Acidimicrobiaceae bacterium]
MNKYLNLFTYLNWIKRLIKVNSKKYKYSKSYMKNSSKNINSSDELIEFHFKTYSDKNHINFEMFKLLLKYFSEKSLNILETGSVAHGSSSTILFIYYINIFGGSLNTVDTNPDIKNKYKHLINKNTQFHTNDSLKFIENLTSEEINKIDLIYLDSFDLDLFDPKPSQEHGLNEFLLLNNIIKKGTLIAIDDTPKDVRLFGEKFKNIHKFIPGKGRLVLDYIDKYGGYEIIYHHYAVILKKI